MFIGSRLKEQRIKFGYTQQQLGDLLHITKTSICYFEKNDRCPNIDTLTDLCNVFGVSADYFLGRDVSVIMEDEKTYGVYLTREEVTFLTVLKQNHKLYEQILSDPKRFVELINLKLK